MDLPHQIELTKKAIEQLKLIFAKDYTIQDKQLRVQIEAKGCDGFTYSIGFTQKLEKDVEIPLAGLAPHKVLLDPFSAFYLKHAIIDYHIDPESHQEGLIVINLDEKNFRGKFFKNNDHLVPHHLKPDNCPS